MVKMEMIVKGVSGSSVRFVKCVFCSYCLLTQYNTKCDVCCIGVIYNIECNTILMSRV